MKKLMLIILLIIPVFSYAQIDCSQFIGTVEDKVEGTKTIEPLKNLIFFDKTDSTKYLRCFTFISAGDLAIWFEFNKAKVVNPDNEIKVLFKDGSRITYDQHYNKKNYKGQYSLMLVKHNDLPAREGVPSPFIDTRELLDKDIDVMRFYWFDEITDFTFKSKDAALLKQILSCMYEKL